MEKRQDIIYEKVKELSWQALERGEEPGVTAQETAQILQMDRGNVSKEMNQLAAKEKLIKYEGRPVRFCETAAYHQYSIKQEAERTPETALLPFQSIIGQEGSLKLQIKQVKAAILYPPHGLHTLLYGPTGSGKTLFAQQMFEYAKQADMLKPDAQMVIFNCAEYAENAQLIVSQIFGHKKGSFTGADRDKPGLVEQADGGILFLDEIHRLPPEGQEMLFSLMDHGKYRRLGETERNRAADVLIIGATTEHLEDVLLKTFLRRMPVTIQLPPLEERPLIERLELIELFLHNEQQKISVSISVSRDVILSLLFYECSGNIGQLKADIQLLCARAFWEYKVGGAQLVEIDRQMLPFYIEQGFYKAGESKNSLAQFLLQGDDSYVFPDGSDNGERKYNVIGKKYMIFHKFYSDRQEAGSDSGIQEYISSIIEREREKESGKSFTRDTLNKVITGKVYYAVEEAVEFAEMRLKRKLSDNIRIGFALHINALAEGIDKKQNIRADKLERIIDAHPSEAKVAKLILRILETELDITVDKNEVGYTTMFLCADEEERKQKKIGLIVIAHGNNTASSIADAANVLLDTTHCRAIDMPLNEEVEEVYKKALQMVVQINEGRGVLLMVDMGSLNMFAERIEEESGVPVRSVGMVSTMPVLEAIRKCTVGEEKISEVADYLEQMMIRMIGEQKMQGRKEKEGGRSAILVTCMSGLGAAKKIADMVRAITGIEEGDSLVVSCVGMDGKDETGQFLAGYKEDEILAVVGTARLQLEQVPYIPLDEIVMGDGIERLEKAISKQKRSIVQGEKNGQIMDERVLVAAMRELLDFFNAETIVSLILPGFYRCVEKLNCTNYEEKIVRYTIHTACMAERLIRHEILPYQEVEAYKRAHGKEFEVISETLKPIEELLRIRVPDTEKAYIVELLTEGGEDCSTTNM